MRKTILTLLPTALLALSAPQAASAMPADSVRDKVLLSTEPATYYGYYGGYRGYRYYHPRRHYYYYPRRHYYGYGYYPYNYNYGTYQRPTYGPYRFTPRW